LRSISEASNLDYHFSLRTVLPDRVEVDNSDTISPVAVDAALVEIIALSDHSVVRAA
jgi:hypothetical protein